jgi:hypothetical protein
MLIGRLMKKPTRQEIQSAKMPPSTSPTLAPTTQGQQTESRVLRRRPRAKELAAELIDDVGFNQVYAGPLRIARYTEPFALLVAQLAYEGTDGPELAYRFELFRTNPQNE